MSLTSSLFAGVSGLNSQSNAIGIIGDNIANTSTVGFKAGSATFSSLVTGNSALSGGAGVTGFNSAQVDQQGLIESTGISTDIALSGAGFFVVADDAENGEAFYSRAGSFTQDDRGFFVNSSGFYLQAWPLDSEGRLPGEIGNLNTTSSQLLESLETVNTRDISGVAFASSLVSLGLNLDASEAILTGAGDTGQPANVSRNNGAAASDVLAPSSADFAQTTIGANVYDEGLEAGDTMTITMGSGTTYDFVYGGFTQSVDITSTSIYGASTADQEWDSSTFAANLSGAEMNVTVAGNSYIFGFGTPGTGADGTRYFNSLSSFASALDTLEEVNANIVNNQLFVSAADARNALTFTDISGTIAADALAGNAGSLSGGTANFFDPTIAAATSGVNRFNSLQGLADLVNAQEEIQATISSETSDASISINAISPLDTISIGNAATNGANMLSEFGFDQGDNLADANQTQVDDTALRKTAITFDATYAASPGSGSESANMASGEISPAFSRNIRIFDSLGVGHDIRVSFQKIDNNEWTVEIYAAEPDEITTANPNGILAFGTIEFNGDGSLRNVSTSLSNAISATWNNDSLAQEIVIDWGTAGEPSGTEGASSIGLTDGLSQFSGDYTVQFAEQNGSSSGLLSSLEIDEDGFVIANFTNGESRQVYKIPVATFPNSNGLNASSGNVFSQSDASGEFSLSEAGTGSAGSVVGGALESANVEVADQLTNLIIAQRAFQANTQVITTVDDLLEQLTQL